MRWSALIVLLVALPAAAELYRWTDENGKVHFSDRPVSDDAEELEVKAPPKLGQGNTVREVNERLDRLRTSEAEREAKEREQEEKLQAKLKKQRAACARQKDRLNSFRNYVMYTLEDDGSRRYYENEEKKQKIAEISKWIAENCKD